MPSERVKKYGVRWDLLSRELGRLAHAPVYCKMSPEQKVCDMIKRMAYQTVLELMGMLERT